MAPNYTVTNAITCHPPVDGERQWKLEQVHLLPPNDDEVVVEMVASGICHTDLGCGSSPDGSPGFPLPPYPRVLGHEGSGYVKSVGARVTKVKPGDAVLLSFAFCTRCDNCQYGAPGYCSQFAELNFIGNAAAFTATHGDKTNSIGGSFFGQSSFARLSRVRETSVVNVSEFLKNAEDLKLFAPLGCGIQTGAGTVTELGGAATDDKVAVIGMGGVGLSAIMGAKLRGCRTIISIDRIDSRLKMAKSLGATHVINTTQIDRSLTDEVREITGGSGAAISIDATGVVPLIQQAVEFTANQGKIILLGVAPMDAGLEIAIVPFMTTGKKLFGSMEGGVFPEDYIPQMIRWYYSGRFPVDHLVKFYKVSDFQQAIHDMESGSTIRPVLLW